MGFGSAKQPSVLARISDARFGTCVNLCRVGNLVYTAGTGANVNIVDVSVPSKPVVVGNLKDATNLANVEAIRVAGNRAFVIGETSARFGVLDVSNPAAPSVVTSLVDAVHFGGATNLRLHPDGVTAYVSTLTRASVCSVDITNPAAPAYIAEQRGPTPGSSMNGARDVIFSADGNYAFVTCDTANCVAVIDIRDRTNLVWVTNITHSALGSARGITLGPDGKKLFVLGAGSSTQGFNGALIVIDVTTPTAPSVLSVFSGYGGFGAMTYFAGGRGIVVYQNYAYITSESGKALIVLDVSNLQNIRFLGGVKGPTSTWMDGAMGLDITNGIACVACFAANAFAVCSVGGLPSP
jgi:hypothetical protein